MVHQVCGDRPADRHSQVSQDIELRAGGEDHLPVADDPDGHAALHGPLEGLTQDKRGERVDGNIDGVHRLIDLLHEFANTLDGAVRVIALEIGLRHSLRFRLYVAVVLG